MVCKHKKNKLILYFSNEISNIFYDKISLDDFIDVNEYLLSVKNEEEDLLVSEIYENYLNNTEILNIENLYEYELELKNNYIISDNIIYDKKDNNLEKLINDYVINQYKINMENKENEINFIDLRIFNKLNEIIEDNIYTDINKNNFNFFFTEINESPVKYDLIEKNKIILNKDDYYDEKETIKFAQLKEKIEKFIDDIKKIEYEKVNKIIDPIIILDNGIEKTPIFDLYFPKYNDYLLELKNITNIYISDLDILDNQNRINNDLIKDEEYKKEIKDFLEKIKELIKNKTNDNVNKLYGYYGKIQKLKNLKIKLNYSFDWEKYIPKRKEFLQRRIEKKNIIKIVW